MQTGMPFGKSNDNPILGTREYSVEFDDGEVRKLTGNVIVESMYAACDDSGKDYLMMDSIVDYQKSDKALSVASKKVVHRGWSFMQRSTVGWQLCIQCRYGLTPCQSPKDLKGSHLVETSKYDMD